LVNPRVDLRDGHGEVIALFEVGYLGPLEGLVEVEGLIGVYKFEKDGEGELRRTGATIAPLETIG